MNWYAILLFLLASPFGWAMIAGLTAVFLYACYRFEKAMKHQEYFKRQHVANVARQESMFPPVESRGALAAGASMAFVLDPSKDYVLPKYEQVAAVQQPGMQLHPRGVNPKVWFGVMLVSGITLILLLAMPVMCTFVTHMCP